MLARCSNFTPNCCCWHFNVSYIITVVWYLVVWTSKYLLCGKFMYETAFYEGKSTKPVQWSYVFPLTIFNYTKSINIFRIFYISINIHQWRWGPKLMKNIISPRQREKKKEFYCYHWFTCTNKCVSYFTLWIGIIFTKPDYVLGFQIIL